jgi:hypothetical protein
MSNALAIAGVTAVLRDLLNDGLLNANADALGQVSVTALPPDRLEPAGQAPTDRLNIFLFQTSRNAAFANDRLPARDAASNRVSNPFLALDLHYILTATGSDELNAEILLGYGLQVLQENPVLSRAAIRTSLGSATVSVDGQILPPSLRLLAASDLADQIEQLRITSMVTDSARPDQIETLSNLWSAFSTALRPSSLFTVSAVLIESTRPTRAALPVLTLGGRTAPIRSPMIDRVQATANGLAQPMAAILPGTAVAAFGHALVAPQMRILLGSRALVVPAAQIGDRRIDLTLPADARAGVGRLMIEHRYSPEGGGAERLWESSNALAFLIQPRLQGVVAARAGAVAAAFTGTLTLTLGHPVDPDQRVEVLLNPLPGGTEAPLVLPARPRALAATEVVADLVAVAGGRYVVRVAVDGAPSVPGLGPQGFVTPEADLR